MIETVGANLVFARFKSTILNLNDSLPANHSVDIQIHKNSFPINSPSHRTFGNFKKLISKLASHRITGSDTMTTTNSNFQLDQIGFEPALTVLIVIQNIIFFSLYNEYIFLILKTNNKLNN